MKHFLRAVVIALGISNTLLSQPMSCAERLKHGPKGLAKASIATVTAAATIYVGREFKRVSDSLRADQGQFSYDALKPSTRLNESYQKCFFFGCAVIALGYVTWLMGSSSIESLRIYADENAENNDLSAQVTPRVKL